MTLHALAYYLKQTYRSRTLCLKSGTKRVSYVNEEVQIPQKLIELLREILTKRMLPRSHGTTPKMTRPLLPKSVRTVAKKATPRRNAGRKIKQAHMRKRLKLSIKEMNQHGSP